MNKNKLIVVIIVLATTAVAVLFGLLLTRSTDLAVGGYSLVIGFVMIFIDPFVGLINYLMFLYIRPQELVAGWRVIPVMALIGAATIGLTLTHMAMNRSWLGLRKAPQHLLVLWFFAAIPVSHLANFHIATAWHYLNYYLDIFILYFLVVILVSSEKKLKVTLYVLFLMTLYLAGQGIVQHFTGVGVAGQEAYRDRVISIGIFSDPNDLALALLTILPFPIILFLDSGSIFKRLILFITIAAIVFTIFVTKSRGGILTLGLMLALITMLRYGWRKAALVGAVAGMLILASGPLTRMDNLSTDEASASERVEAWTVGINLLQSRPLFGVGAGTFTLYHYITAHNSVVLAASETGLFGLFAWLTLFYISIKNLFYIKRESAKEGWTSLAMCAEVVMLGLVAFFMAAFFLSRTYNPVLYIMFGLAAAVTALFVDKSPARYVLFDKRDFINASALTIGSVIAIKAFLIWAW